MTFGDPVRLRFVELLGLMVGLEQEWRAQGASEAELSLEAFDSDYAPVEKYANRLAMWGGIDEHVLREGGQAITGELEYRMQPCMGIGISRPRST